jgi:hypothetical protein
MPQNALPHISLLMFQSEVEIHQQLFQDTAIDFAARRGLKLEHSGG